MTTTPASSTLDPRTASALNALGLQSLTPMQMQALEAGRHDKRDLVLLAPTGTGKTLAFLLPLLESLQPTAEAPHVQALVVAPSRELALQIDEVFRRMKTPWTACCCYGGHATSQEKQRLLTTQPALVIGTPGRLLDHLERGNLKADHLHTFVIDEFDKALELGFHEQMARLMELLPPDVRRVLVSATEAEEIPQFVNLGHCHRLNHLAPTANETSASARLQLMQVVSPEKDKADTLYRLLCSLGEGRSMVFCNHRESVDRLHRLLAERGFPTERFHGGMEQPQRERALYKFRHGSSPVLLSTDLAARGLDIPGVEHIIHYHLPTTHEAYTHRNGRTARWQATGTSYILRHADEPLPPYIDTHLPTHRLPDTPTHPPRPEWTTLYIGRGKKEKLSRGDIAGFIHKKGGLAREDVGAIDLYDHHAFVTVRRNRVKQLLTLVQGEKIKGMKTLVQEAL